MLSDVRKERFLLRWPPFERGTVITTSYLFKTQLNRKCSFLTVDDENRFTFRNIMFEEKCHANWLTTSRSLQLWEIECKYYDSI
jgi:hypothetical protein